MNSIFDEMVYDQVNYWTIQKEEDLKGFLKVKTSLSEDGIDYFVLKDDSFFTVDVCEGVKSRSPPVVA